MYIHLQVHIFSSYTLIIIQQKYSSAQFLCLSLFLVLYNFQIVSNFSLSRFIQFDSIVYSLSSLFCLSLFLILYKFKLYIIILYTYNNTIRFYTVLCPSVFLFLVLYTSFYTICFNYICIENYTVSMFAMERNYANFVVAYKYEFFICYMWKLPFY